MICLPLTKTHQTTALSSLLVFRFLPSQQTYSWKWVNKKRNWKRQTTDHLTVVFFEIDFWFAFAQILTVYNDRKKTMCSKSLRETLSPRNRYQLKYANSKIKEREKERQGERERDYNVCVRKSAHTQIKTKPTRDRQSYKMQNKWTLFARIYIDNIRTSR